MESILKDGMKVIAPSECCNNLTSGKEYEVFNVRVSPNKQCKFIFNINDDYNEICYCLLIGCGHLLNGNWIIKYELKNELISLIKTRILEYKEPNGSMVQFEIDGFAYDVDYTSTIRVKDGLKSGDYDTPDDKDLLTVDLHSVDIRNVWDDNGDMLPADKLKEINKEFYILN